MQEEKLPSTGLGLASALAQRLQVNDVWFNDRAVSLDGYNFQSCRFDNCKLHIASANFEMHKCFVDDNTVIFYHGEMVKILRLFNCRYHWIYQKLPYFAPVRHENGTISIVF